MALSSMYEIVNGPSKGDLFVALYDRNQGRMVTFNLPVSDPSVPGTAHLVVKARIDTIGAEDGSGESWTIEFTDNANSRSPTRYKGWYNTQSRKGRIEMI